jgi:hypothetical protein
VNAAILASLVGLFGIGLGFAAGVATRRYGSTLAGGALAVAVLYVLYIVNVGEGAPFAPNVMGVGAVGGGVLLGSFAVGVALARAFERGQSA